MKKNTGRLLAFVGAYTSKNKQSSDVLGSVAFAPVDTHTKPCFDRVSVRLATFASV